jgi:hypothetical protein
MKNTNTISNSSITPKKLKINKPKPKKIINTMNNSKKVKPQDNNANVKNANLGNVGTNKQFDQAQGNRGKQLNPNQENIKNK